MLECKDEGPGFAFGDSANIALPLPFPCSEGFSSAKRTTLLFFGMRISAGRLVKLFNFFCASTNLPRKSRSTRSAEVVAGAVTPIGGVGVPEPTLCQEEGEGTRKFAAFRNTADPNRQRAETCARELNSPGGLGSPGGGPLVLVRPAAWPLLAEADGLPKGSGGVRGDLGAYGIVDVARDELDFRRLNWGLVLVLPAVATMGILDRLPLVVRLRVGLEDEPEAAFEAEAEVRAVR